MFTGIIEEIGTLSRIERTGGFCQLVIQARKVLDDCKAGDSIAVNGVCLTVTRRQPDGFVADVMAETMRRSNLGTLKAGDKLNLERSLRLGDRLGGHIVAGHVDEVGTIVSLRPEDIATIMAVSVSPQLMKYIAVKGSVCVEGVSLTVVDVSGKSPQPPFSKGERYVSSSKGEGDASFSRGEGMSSSFQVSLIPFTKENTTLGLKRVGNTVNIEVDMLARYVERLVRDQGIVTRGQGIVAGDQGIVTRDQGISREFLERHGFS